jgi:hypothetical protein
MATPHVGAYKACLKRRHISVSGAGLLSCFCIFAHDIFALYHLWKQTTAGIAALYWDQQPSLTIEELWSQIVDSAATGAVKNADGPNDSVATTLGTFTTEPATKDPLKVCPLPPRPLAPTPAPPPSSTEDEEKNVGLIIIISLVVAAVAGGVVCWCIGQLKSGGN